MNVRSRIFAGAILTVIGLVLLPARSAGADAQLVTLLRGSSYTIVENSGNVIVSMPVALATGVSVGDLQVTTVDVALASVHDPGLEQRFVASFRAAPTGGVPALDLTIAADPGLSSGTYDVLLQVSTKHPLSSSSAVPSVQQLDVQIVHPAAQLTAIPTLVIQRTLCWHIWWCPAPKVVIPPLALEETTSQSRLTDITVIQTQPGSNGGEPSLGRVETVSAISVPAGTAKDIELILKPDSFALGTTTGSFAIHARQLSTPVTVSYQVDTRRDPKAILLVAALGLGLGFLTRTVLKRIIDRQTAQRQVDDQLAVIDSELARRPDGTFQLTMVPIREQLAVQRNQVTDPTQLATDVTTAQTALQGAITEMEGRRPSTAAAIDALKRLLGADWQVPTSIAKVISDRSASLADASGLFATDDLKGAQDAVDRANTDLGADLLRQVASWTKRVDPLLHALADQTLPDTAWDVADAAKAVVSEIGQLPAAVTASELGSFLRSVDTAYGNALLVEHLLSRLPDVAGRVVQLLRSADAPAGDVERLSAAANAAAQTLAAAPIQHDADTDEVATAVDALLAALASAFADVPVTLPERAAIQQAASAGRYEAAAQQWVTATRAAQATAFGERLLAEDGTFAQDAAVPPLTSEERPLSTITLASILRRGPGLGAPGGAFVLSQPAAAPFAVNKYWSLGKLVAAKALQTLIVASLLVVVGYALYWKNFVGTGADFSAIFFWAFGLDITVDALVTASRSIASGAAGAA